MLRYETQPVFSDSGAQSRHAELSRNTHTATEIPVYIDRQTDRQTDRYFIVIVSRANNETGGATQTGAWKRWWCKYFDDVFQCELSFLAALLTRCIHLSIGKIHRCLAAACYSILAIKLQSYIAFDMHLCRFIPLLHLDCSIICKRTWFPEWDIMNT